MNKDKEAQGELGNGREMDRGTNKKAIFAVLSQCPISALGGCMQSVPDMFATVGGSFPSARTARVSVCVHLCQGY